jgi:hypothetical protein
MGQVGALSGFAFTDRMPIVSAKLPTPSLTEEHLKRRSLQGHQ